MIAALFETFTPEKQEGRPRTVPLKTHCRLGHEYTPENTRWNCGRRYCRACVKIKQFSYHVRIKDEANRKNRERYHAKQAQKRAVQA